ncbi:hypothetical protein EW146_g240 [Bondarzewia mesenterica]|uniref:Major facilitator superfamily (MFS) profile domain-containing protein n=1 Tax=Bondarzewia mesenterica TaxID=1095465 RepID=A0A4S4M7H0_9AGAM|nr:hypothetical protein EW146_g240 [Bondarzewia mesenterica]
MYKSSALSNHDNLFDPIISPDLSTVTLAPHSRSRIRTSNASQIRPADTIRYAMQRDNSVQEQLRSVSETDPLLGGEHSAKKPFYRPRPLWIVPFAIIASISRGMTLAPRVEVFTQLSCNALHDHYNHTSGNSVLNLFSSSVLYHPSLHSSPDPLPINFPHLGPQDDSEDDGSEDPRRLPSQICLSDPAVQSGAARLQTIMVVIMGILSTLTTGWWGRFGERHGRTKVLVASTLGLLLTDIAFILVSTPSSPLSHHGHKLLLLSPVFEGLLGGWSSLQGATIAYVSDCTSDGSRSHIFSRFMGVFYLGFSIGPALGAFFIRHPLLHSESNVLPSGKGVPTVTTVFWVAIACSFVNLLLSAFVFPESLGKAKLKAAQKASTSSTSAPDTGAVSKDDKKQREGLLGLIEGFFSPLAIFAPRKRNMGIDSLHQRRDWSLTWLAFSLFGYMLAMVSLLIDYKKKEFGDKSLTVVKQGVFQLKYLYAEHVFGWGAEQLSYYISFVGGARAVHLLFVMPWLIAYFTPETPSLSSPTTDAASLHHSISFDLAIMRFSLVLDVLSHTLVSLPLTANSVTFSGFTVISSFASGMLPAGQSLAICIMQRNGLGEDGLGALFGAISALQAAGQMILGPLLFGMVYSSTVAQFPQAIFILAGALTFISLSMLFLIRADPATPLRLSAAAKGKAKVKPKPKRRSDVDRERGRSRSVKHVGDGPSSSVGTAGPSSNPASVVAVSGGSGHHAV